MVYAPPKRKLTVEDYHRMGEAGIFGRDERVELLDGELYTMAPIGEDHNAGVLSLSYFLNRRVGERVIVSVQGPLRLSAVSEPEPDIVLLRFRDDFYRGGHPRPEDVLLLVEVAHSSLGHDRLTKLPLYAAAGIPEVWIANLVDRQVEVYRDPTPEGYATISVHVPGDSLTPRALPDVSIRVEEIIG